MTSPTRASAPSLTLATLAIAVAIPLPLPAFALPPAGAGGADDGAPGLVPVAALTRSVPRQSLRRLAKLPRPSARRPVFPVRAAFNWGQGGARFGAARGGRSHEGQDVMARAGSPLVAIGDGVVLEAGNDGGRGNYLVIYDRRRGRSYVYLHLRGPARVAAGERVRAGQRVGEVGCTGSCFGDHLHLEVRRGRGPSGPAIDPRPLLMRASRSPAATASLPPGAH